MAPYHAHGLKPESVPRRLAGLFVGVFAFTGLHDLCFALPPHAGLRGPRPSARSVNCHRAVEMSASVGARDPPAPYDETLYVDIERLADVWGRREAFKELAQSLRPAWPEKDVKKVVRRHAKKLWPKCSLHVVGSFDRDVHNKDFSDLDIHIRDPDEAYVTKEEVQDLMGLLKNDPEVSQFEQGSKAMRLLVFGVPTDVVCADRFEAQWQMHCEERIAALEKLYEKYPGARNAARVAKWLFLGQLHPPVQESHKPCFGPHRLYVAAQNDLQHPSRAFNP